MGWPRDGVWWAKVKSTGKECGASENFDFMEERHAATAPRGRLMPS